ncbi:MAG TPA: ParA family protein [Kiritimatiellia bacterium]|nr:ParA family protein [Kiritimatiellia bacterium]
MKTHIVSVANQKGGVGKTTTSVNLSACVAERGRRVLLIDFDAQANATSGLGLEKIEGVSLYPVLIGQTDPREFIRPTAYKRLDIIPAEVNLAGAEIEVARLDGYLHRLKHALRPLVDENRYDHIFIDCPPSLGILTMNALCASDGLLMPIQCEYYALEGLSVMVKLIQQLRESGANPDLEIEGIIMTMYDSRTNLAQQVVQQVSEYFGDKVYKSVIPRSVRVSEAPSFGKPVVEYDRHSTGASAYRQLAREFLQRRKGAGASDGPVTPQAEPAGVDTDQPPTTHEQ